MYQRGRKGREASRDLNYDKKYIYKNLVDNAGGGGGRAGGGV